MTKPKRPEAVRRRSKRIIEQLDGVEPNAVIDGVVEDMQRRIKTQVGRAAREDFWFFLHKVWGSGHPGYQKLQAPLHKDIARFFQDAVLEWEYVMKEAQRDPESARVVRYLLEVFRGAGKSLIFTIAGSAWIMLRHPDVAIAIDARDMPLARGYLRAIKERLDGTDNTSKWVEHYGSERSQERMWATDGIIIKSRKVSRTEPTYACTAVNVSGTGTHPPVVFTDDPVDETDRNDGAKLLAAVNHYRSWANILPNPALHLVSGTPYCDSDVLAHIEANECVVDPELPQIRPFRIFKQEALVIDAEGNEVSVAPSVRSTQFLKRERKIDPVNFAAQYMLRPGEGAHQPLTLAQCQQLIVTRGALPVWDYYTTWHLDLAWQSDEGTARGDRSVIAQVRHGSNLSFLTYGWAKTRCKQEEFLARFVMLLRQAGYGPDFPVLVTMDAELGGIPGVLKKIFENECSRNGVFCPAIEPLQRQGIEQRKLARMRMSAGMWAVGRFRLLNTAGSEEFSLERLFYEATHLGSSGHDDLFDTLSDVWHPKVIRHSPFLQQSEGAQGLAGNLWTNEPAAPLTLADSLPLLPSQAFDGPIIPHNRENNAIVQELIDSLKREGNR